MLLNRFTRLKGVGRYACLGNAVLETLGRKYKFHNIQKGRIDYLLNAIDNPLITCVPAKIVPHLARDYIAPTIQQQSVLCPSFKPELVFLDSFSELADQLFRHKTEGWQFCCNYQDLAHDERLARDFECIGLVKLDGLKDAYMRALEVINARWPGIPVIYLHFPDVLEDREKFVTRAQEIKYVIEECAAVASNLYSFSVPAGIVKRPAVVESGMENFPYHFSQETYRRFADDILAVSALQTYF